MRLINLSMSIVMSALDLAEINRKQEIGTRIREVSLSVLAGGGGGRGWWRGVEYPVTGNEMLGGRRNMWEVWLRKTRKRQQKKNQGRVFKAEAGKTRR